jgi:hypothetical protein
MSKPLITYTQRCDSTRGAEVAGLANLYSFVLKRSQAKRKSGVAPDRHVFSLSKRSWRGCDER